MLHPKFASIELVFQELKAPSSSVLGSYRIDQVLTRQVVEKLSTVQFIAIPVAIPGKYNRLSSVNFFSLCFTEVYSNVLCSDSAA